MKKAKHHITTRNTRELADALGIASPVDQALMEYKAELSDIVARAIFESGLTVNEIVTKSGVARSKVSAIKNGSLAGISCDLFIKIIAATGVRIKFKMVS
jgi:predicted XRE-type DNA-binding protein